jgi:hypothetical protein
LTRGQLRYREYLEVADSYDWTFREFLKMREMDWYKHLGREMA